MITVDEILAEALSWKGTPFVHGQWRKGVGCDCAGYVRGVFSNLGVARELGYILYQRLPTEADVLKADEVLARYADRVIPVTERRAGDVLRFKWRRLPAHFGIATGPHTVIHAFAPNPVCESPVSGLLEKSLVEVWRVRT